LSHNHCAHCYVHCQNFQLVPHPPLHQVHNTF
jgi:hypothetical protein